MSNLKQPAAEWLKDLFEFECCAEYGGDAQHHTAIPFAGNWFAQCIHAPDDEGNPHPTIARFRAEECA